VIESRTASTTKATRSRRVLPARLATFVPAGSLRGVIQAVVLGVVILALPAVFTPYWVQIFTSVAVYSIVALSLALLLGRVGLVSLGQIALLALGGWVALRLHFAFALPFEVLLVVTGLVVGVVGTLIGLPALRLSGLYLALITLMAAAGFTQVLQATNFPNGGPGFLGYSSSIMGTTTATASLPFLPRGRGCRRGHVPDWLAARPRSGRPSLGSDSPE
jgi:ABC-type branched-subunit amino acid transport system permease subunit